MSSSSNSSSTSSGGIGLVGALFLVFLVLKLTGFISWSWWRVTAPLWISACVAIIMLIVVLAVVITGTARSR
jgi:membrane protein YdbS with pleckstrin-like domain